MPKTVDALVKVKNADAQQVLDFVKSRFSDIFSKVTSSPTGQDSWTYKGGSLLRPYGFKALISVEAVSGDATMLKIAGRPKMGLMAYLLMLVAATLLIFGLSNPIQGFWGLIAAAVLVIASKRDQKKVSKQLEQIAAETVTRFS
jgi:hypothetical protein